MAKERLSKLQKWILNKCSTEGISRSDAMGFFGKKYSGRYRDQKSSDTKISKDRAEYYFNEGFPDRKGDFEERVYDEEVYDWKRKKNVIKKMKYYVCKDDLIITKSENVVITKSLQNLVKKNLLSYPEKRGKYYLTKKGSLLKANNATLAPAIISNKKRQEELRTNLNSVLNVNSAAAGAATISNKKCKDKLRKKS